MYKVDFGNIVLDIQFVIGLIGLISGNLTINKDLPIKNNQARIIGFIFLLPLLSSLIGFTSWSDLLPAIISIGIALIYLYWTTPPLDPKVYEFWLIAMIPVLIRFIFSRLPSVWNSVVDFNLTLPLHGAILTYFPFFVFEILIPVTITFLVTLLFPAANNKIIALLFAIPALLFHIHYSVMNWLVLYFLALQDPNGAFSTSAIIPFIIDIIAGFIVFLGIAFTAWLGSNTKLFVSKNRPT